MFYLVTRRYSGYSSIPKQHDRFHNRSLVTTQMKEAKEVTTCAVHLKTNLLQTEQQLCGHNFCSDFFKILYNIPLIGLGSD